MKNKDIKIRESLRFDLQRRVVSHMTSASWQAIPHVSYIYEPDITDFYREYLKLAENRSAEGHKITFNTVMLKVITEGLRTAPELNAHIEYNHKKSEGTTHILDEMNVSVPWLLPDGKMITPAIPNAAAMSLNDISAYMHDLSERIGKTNIDEMLYRAVFADTVSELKKFNLSIFRRIIASQITRYRVKGLQGAEKEAYYKIPEKDRLTEKDIMLGTVTVSNIGSLYRAQRGFFALLEIIPPQVFAIGLGSVQEKPGVFVQEDGSKDIGIRKILPMCLAFDHRAADFSAVIPFIKKLDEIFAAPEVVHAW
ncbi:pyruvate dehydrogenase E2 component (dihydrolipoamide acetyltransferase) [Sporobacter termitidis DSM 10068]|uniref:Pyruvate dehydrogenase E2 component (Dihydrolipoamide acetyltransferase) n=1 Tax=Sporobacter termitidis DSM 10068 TaxID=1123282 RepID=A0A1M5WXK6_9FIRM|nr:2-oxo acid dehydrogenase subunit E2 [Sporobacter termitidis]SHH92230.1 pyruvate dehydrogenase E2 component (dihydrolipoamide acetyltransferase) [Sporobacter termitidis DSM 10068]